MNNELQNVYEELSQCFYKLRAEVFVTELEEKTTLSDSDTVVSCRSTFNRGYRSDISQLTLVDDQKDNAFLNFDLARNGLYDLLPEGVFHKVNDRSNHVSYTAYRKQQSKEEEAARLLFAPIENEFFRQRVAIEKKEKAIVRDFNNLEDGFLMDFWKIDQSIPQVYAAKLMRLLPYAHQIAGDLEQTFLSLEKLLGVAVSYKKVFETIEVKLQTPSENRLGIDFITHQETLSVQQPVIYVSIQPCKKNEVDQFLGKSGLLRFVEVFYSFFIPIEYNVRTEIEVNQENEFILDKEVGAYLGMSTRV
ncbi:hypothetical protein F6U93_10140 [Tamlana haliotis]|uniref:Type VI secretion system baseplate subunit TssG n=1 Tax=Pseudotamlana haliotis TaxID=2614804 RepID=A0A6N6ME72_9FLAO|nr:hypothetical protein [Tamlana haliotis]KAB1067636.1 hypothetical protein F6U93_10140 [Tamlana haliotis]